MKKVLLAFLILLASLSVILGVKAGIEEVRAYQALKVDHAEILKYLGEPIATTKGKDGTDVPVNRPMVLDEIIKQALTPAAPPVK